MEYIQTEYANYLLQFEWDAYYTQTFRTKRNDSVNCALSVWQYLENKLEWTRGFIAAEKHKLGGYHLHALLADELTDWSIPNAASYMRSRHSRTKSYMQKAFGWNHIESARNQATVSLYCAKYVVKDDSDYYFMGHWSKPE